MKWIGIITWVTLLYVLSKDKQDYKPNCEYGYKNGWSIIKFDIPSTQLYKGKYTQGRIGTSHRFGLDDYNTELLINKDGKWVECEDAFIALWQKKLSFELVNLKWTNNYKVILYFRGKVEPLIDYKLWPGAIK